MKPILTAKQMREADRRTIEDLGIPGFTLMETAGRAATREIVSHFGEPELLSVCCLCGKGNNGGDALVIARLLADAGAEVLVQMVLGTDDLSADAEANWSILTRLAGESSGMALDVAEGPHIEDRGFDLVVDGMLGTGLTSALRDPLATLVRDVNASGVPVVAIDVPTGLNADTGEIMGDCITANLTVTMGALKQGLLVGEGPDRSGEIVVVEIGIPGYVLEGSPASGSMTWLPEHSDVSWMIPRRPRQAHKYSAGMVLAIAGSSGLTGAPVLASTAAARSGAGAVVCACPSTVQPVLATRFEEVMTLPLPVSDGGLLAEEGMRALQERLEQASAALVGCGLGRAEGTGEFVRRFLSEIDLPTVIDADGLYALDAQFLEDHGRPHWILTPHPGELRRLVGGEMTAGGSIEQVRTFAARWNSTVILKGAPTVVGCPDGAVFVNPTGNQALASAGTGDVLAGMCASFLAQGAAAREAAVAALFIGGTVVDRFADRYHLESMVAGDIVDLLPEVLTDFA